MNPIEAIAESAKLNPKFTRYLIAVLAVLAVVIVAKGWFEDDYRTPLVGSLFVFLGIFFVYLLSFLKNNTGIQISLLWFVRCILVCCGLLMLTSVSYVIAGVPSDLPCRLPLIGECSRLVQNPNDQAAVAANTLRVDNDDQVNQSLRKKYTVYFQFAGYDREAIRSLVSKLRTNGWSKIPDEERTSKAAALNEIRYRSDDDKIAANLLAADMAKSNFLNIKIRKVGIIQDSNLEVWISR